MRSATRPRSATCVSARGWQLAGTALGDSVAAIYVVYNRDAKAIAVTLPPAPVGAWHRVADTGAWMEAQANFAVPGSEHRMQQSRYDLAGRSLAVFLAK